MSFITDKNEFKKWIEEYAYLYLDEKVKSIEAFYYSGSPGDIDLKAKETVYGEFALNYYNDRATGATRMDVTVSKRAPHNDDLRFREDWTAAAGLIHSAYYGNDFRMVEINDITVNTAINLLYLKVVVVGWKVTFY